MQLELSEQEREILVRVVDAAVREMRVEVRRTSTPRYHDDLVAEEHALQALLKRLQGQS
ncbi:MAG: hypothetical protein QNK03_22940 [Myxococcota bacterium]|nr:hypothetical protein [Myxococcota bacterium]